MKKTACEDSSRLYDINSDKFIEFLKNCAFRENFCPLSICVLRNAEYFCVFFSRKNIFFGDEKKETEKSRKIQLKSFFSVLQLNLSLLISSFLCFRKIPWISAIHYLYGDRGFIFGTIR